MIGWKAIFAIFLAFNGYLIIGMLAFHFLEMENEDFVRQDIGKYKQKILANFTCLGEQELENLIMAVKYAIDNGLDPSSNSTITRSNWEYHSAFFFSGTVITTIGYGHISPSTVGGQIFCIFYALLGIPLCGILLSSLGDRLCKIKDTGLERATDKFKLKKQWQQKIFKMFATLFVGLGLFIFIPASIFVAVEGWNYHEAWYYCFITLTTVGFGDFVAGQNPDINYPTMYKIMVFYWIILGLVFLAIIIQDISSMLASKVEKIEANMNILVGMEEKGDKESSNGTGQNGKGKILPAESPSNSVEVALVEESNT